MALAQLQTKMSSKMKYLHFALNLPFTKVTPYESTRVLSDISETYLDAGKIDSPPGASMQRKSPKRWRTRDLPNF